MRRWRRAEIDRESFPAGPFRFHDLRHTFGTLGAKVFPLHGLRAYMGHANIETTMIYAHHVPKPSTSPSRMLKASVTRQKS
jgi:integrase